MTLKVGNCLGDAMRLYCYEDHPEVGPTVWLSKAPGTLPPPPPDVPPSVFAVT